MEENTMTLKSIYDIDLNSAEGNADFLKQYKGKVTMVVNTTVGCGNANQLEVLQWLQEKYQDQGFEIIGVPTNDYCGPGITKGKWADGITCGLDSKNYGEDVYGTTFKYSEMVSSNPHEKFYEIYPHANENHERRQPHELYVEISSQMKALRDMKEHLEDSNVEGKFMPTSGFNIGFYDQIDMGGNYEKYLIDKDGYVMKHFANKSLNYDTEKTLKESLMAEGHSGPFAQHGGRTMETFNEEYSFVCSEIEKAIAGARSALNPSLVKV
jgi:glutathione peroxidase